MTNTEMASTVLDFLKLAWPLLAIDIIIRIYCVYKAITGKVKHLPKVAWVLIILCVNLFGWVSFLIFGRDKE